MEVAEMTFDEWLDTNGLTEDWHCTHNACDYAKAAWNASQKHTAAKCAEVINRKMLETHDSPCKDCTSVTALCGDCIKSEIYERFVLEP